MKSTYRAYDELPLTLHAADVADVLGISRGGAYALMHQKGFPTICIGRRMVVPRDKFLVWLDEQSKG